MAKIRAQTTRRETKHRATAMIREKSTLSDVIKAEVEAHYKQYKKLDPTEVLVTLLRFHYKQNVATIQRFQDVRDFFYKPTNDDFESFKFPVVTAVRSGDTQALEKMRQQEGISLTCCNSVGESILHTACRKGQTRVVKYLLEDFGVPVNMVDEYGRTPLHDAMWTATPNFELVDLLISRCPDLLFIKDARGHCPLTYAPRQVWKTWVKRFARNIRQIKPCVL